MPPLVALLTAGTDNAKEHAANALGNLANTEPLRADVASAGAASPLVALLTAGTDDAKRSAANTLGNLAVAESLRTDVASAGAVPPLVALLTAGTDTAKGHAANALGWLANTESLQADMWLAGIAFSLAVVATDGPAEASSDAAARLRQLRVAVEPHRWQPNQCVPGEEFVVPNAAAASTVPSSRAGLCAKCPRGFSDDDSDPETPCQRCVVDTSGHSIVGHAGSCALLHEAVQLGRDEGWAPGISESIGLVIGVIGVVTGIAS